DFNSKIKKIRWLSVKNLGKSNSKSRIVDQNDPTVASSAVIHSSSVAAEPHSRRQSVSPRSTSCSSPLRRQSFTEENCRTPCGRSSYISSKGPNSPTTAPKASSRTYRATQLQTPIKLAPCSRNSQ
ncbi:Unknown protein, partial [Striga hermonthica]